MRWPENIKVLQIQCYMKSNYEDIAKLYDKEFSIVAKDKKIVCLKNQFQAKELKDTLVITVSVEILKIVNNDGLYVPKFSWHKYGIIIAE